SQSALESTISALRAFVERQGGAISRESALQGGRQFWISDGAGETPISLYASGKALIQGKPGALQAALQGWWQAQGSGETGTAASALPAALGVARIGLDESGKGDYFGPLVVAAAFVDPESEQPLRTLGVQDSKRLTDPQIARVAAAIGPLAPHAIVT